MLRLFGGLVLFVSTFYCGPRRRTGKGRRKEGAGIYPELSLLGFSEGISPALASEIARQSALLSSFDLARREMERRGVPLDIKVVHRISIRLGQEILSVRKRDLLPWREGKLPSGKELAGKRIGVAIDGGRTRIREKVRRQRGKGRNKKQRRGWEAQWREPKKFIIFEVDEKGRMKRGTRSFIDGTFQGPDALMELLAMRLHQLGAAEAESITFLGDGASWIWNRLDEVIRLAGLPKERVEKVLDFYHGTQHIHLALLALGFFAPEERQRAFKRLRKQLKKGRVKEVIKELKGYVQKKGVAEKALEREIKFLEKHAPHMAYDRIRAEGKPMGSGAIESVIRRVLNQRLKGNGIMWTKANAEAVMVLRGTILSDRWEETLDHVRATMATDRKIDWKWSSPDMRQEKIPDETDWASVPQTLTKDRVKGIQP